MNNYTYVGIDTRATGARIKKLREENNYTVEMLCSIFFISPQAIYKWQKGDAMPTLDNIFVLSDLFHVKVEDIVVRKNHDVHFLSDKESVA